MHKALNNLNLLRTFDCAARNNSYSLAAIELCISQAAVSQQMRQLQRLVGQQLFIRQGRSMFLTQSGEILFAGTQDAISVLTRSINTICTESVAGELTISSTQAFSSIWLMPRLHVFSKLHPEITINIHSSAEFEDLKTKRIDLAIRFGKNVEKQTCKKYLCDYFGDGAVYPVCSPELLKEHRIKDGNDILSNWLVQIGHNGPFDWQEWAVHYGFTKAHPINIYTTVNSTDMALNAVVNKHGFALIVDYLCESYIDSGALCVPLKLPHPNVVKRYFVYEKESPKYARIKVFMDWIKSQMI